MSLPSVFGSDEMGVIASSHLRGLAQVPHEVSQIKSNLGYLWLMEHMGKLIVVHQTMKEALEGAHVSRMKHEYTQSLSLRDNKVVELTANLKEQENWKTKIAYWERAWKHE